jgi:hypothetical protein
MLCDVELLVCVHRVGMNAWFGFGGIDSCVPQAPFVAGGGTLVGVVSTGSSFNTNKADMSIVHKYLQPGMFEMMRNNTGWQRMFGTISFNNHTGVTHPLSIRIGWQQGRFSRKSKF